jgi:hypothetical protein
MLGDKNFGGEAISISRRNLLGSEWLETIEAVGTSTAAFVGSAPGERGRRRRR